MDTHPYDDAETILTKARELFDDRVLAKRNEALSPAGHPVSVRAASAKALSLTGAITRATTEDLEHAALYALRCLHEALKTTEWPARPHKQALLMDYNDCPTTDRQDIVALINKALLIVATDRCANGVSVA